MYMYDVYDQTVSRAFSLFYRVVARTFRISSYQSVAKIHPLFYQTVSKTSSFCFVSLSESLPVSVLTDYPQHFKSLVLSDCL